MKIKTIEVSAGRTFNHPYESFANLRFDLKFQAELSEGEEAMDCLKDLQTVAEKAAEEHKANLINDIHALEEMARSQRQMSDLEQRIKQAQDNLETLKENAERHAQTGTKLLPAIASVYDEDDIDF